MTKNKILETITLASTYLYLAGYAFNTGYFFDYQSHGLFLTEFADIIGTILSYEFHVSLLTCLVVCGTVAFAMTTKRTRISILAYAVSLFLLSYISYEAGSNTGFSEAWNRDFQITYVLQILYGLTPWLIATIGLQVARHSFKIEIDFSKAFLVLSVVALLAFIPTGNLWFKHQALSVISVELKDKTLLTLRAGTFINKGIIAFDQYDETVIIPKEEIKLVSTEGLQTCELLMLFILEKPEFAKKDKKDLKKLMDKKLVQKCMLTKV